MITLIKQIYKLYKEEKSKDFKPLTEYEKITLLINKIDANSFINFNNSSNSLIEVRTLYKRLPIYINKLKEVNGYLSKNKAIYNGWCLDQEESIKLNDFFLTTKDFYIEEETYIEDFKKLSNIFFQFYYEHSLSVEVGEHNQRVLFNFKESLINTLEDLLSTVENIRLENGHQS